MPTEFVFGIEVDGLPDGAQAIESFTIVKALDENQELVLYRRASDGWLPWELVGVLVSCTDSARDDVQGGVVRDDD